MRFAPVRLGGIAVKSYINRRFVQEGRELIFFGTTAVLCILLTVICGVCYNYLQCKIYEGFPYAVPGGFSLHSVVEPASLLRMLLFLAVWLFLACHVLFDIRKMYDFIFRKRWWIALIFFVACLALRLNLSSVAMWYHHIQPDIQGDFDRPVFGIERGIRSDEWLVDTPQTITAEYAGYGEMEYISRGTENYTIASSGLYRGYSALWNPLNWGYFIGGSEFGISWKNCGAFILSFMLSFELALILTRRKRLVALLGAVLIALSPWSLWWWPVASHVTSMQGVVLCCYYFFHVEKRWQKLLLGVGAALSSAMFICQLYPAWQVPLAYILLAFVAWIIIEHREQFFHMGWKDIGTIVLGLAFLASIVLAYLYDKSAYTQAVMATVYPGHRVSTGGYALDKLGLYTQTFLYPVKNGYNASADGVCFSLFPIPMLYGAYVFVRQLVRKRRDHAAGFDVLNAVLLIPAAFLTLYCSVGFPGWLASVTLMRYSLSVRAVDMLGLLNVYFIIRLISADPEERYYPPKAVGAAVAAAGVALSVWRCVTTRPGFAPAAYFCVVGAFTLAFGIALLCDIPARTRKAVLCMVCVVLGGFGLLVLPVQRGLDPLLEKPASHAIRKIVDKDPDAKWIGYNDFVLGGFVVANGGPCVTSVNYVPNMELWQALDPSGQYEEVYNRYAHVTMEFTEGSTCFELIQGDHMKVNLSYEDIVKTGATYVFSVSAIEEDSDMIDLSPLYQESNVWIYEIEYL